MCKHPLPSDSAALNGEIVSVNTTGKCVDSLGSPKVTVQYVCPSCGSAVESTTYIDIRSRSIEIQASDDEQTDATEQLLET